MRLCIVMEKCVLIVYVRKIPIPRAIVSASMTHMACNPLKIDGNLQKRKHISSYTILAVYRYTGLAIKEDHS